MAQINWARIIEDAVVGRLIAELVDNNFRVEISNQDGGNGLYVYAAEDGGEKPEGGYTHYVRLTPGNGADVITDYTTNLETVLKPVNDFAASFEEA